MRPPRILVAGCLVALACLALSGCVAEARDGPTSVATPTATGTSPFASNDEALAAAVAAFQRYLDVQNAVTSDSTLSLDSFKDVAIEPLLAVELSGAQKQRDSGLVRRGSVSVDSPIFEYAEYQQDGRLMVVSFLCLDLAQARIFDEDGNDVTPDSRDERAELHVYAFAKEPGGSDLIIGRSELWQYAGRC